MQPASHDIRDALFQFGAAESQICLLNQGHVSNDFLYKDIKEIDGVLLTGVVESRGKPMLYVVRGDSLILDSAKIEEISKRLACRGGYAYLAVLEPGKLTLYPCVLEDAQLHGQAFDSNKHPSLIHGLSEGVAPKSLAEAQKLLSDFNLRKQMLNAFMYAADSLRELRGLKPVKNRAEERRRTSIILSILGRVMFMRYLCDRNLVPSDVVVGYGDRYLIHNIFNNVSDIARIFCWLDETFNGDLLPLIPEHGAHKGQEDAYIDFLSKFPSGISRVMNRFFNGEDSSQLALIRQLHFQYVPASLLSEVYQSFAHKYYAAEARDTSVHYTPQHIASVLVEHSFEAFEKSEMSFLRVLDPSAGAGVFLVLCLRKLVLAHVAQGKEVDEHLIRSVLYNQLRGADINPHALRLGTLALYLTAIELDPIPQPVEKQHFDRPLLGSVLYDVADSVGLGALSEGLSPEELGGPFDLVIGNPPWTKITGEKNKELQVALRNSAARTVKRVWPEVSDYLKERQLTGAIFSPDYSPVFPFLWRSLEWARDNGVVAMALPAELLLFREAESRQALFRRMRVTGVVNGADLNNTKFWEGVNEPFCLLFARNIPSARDDSFLFVSPYVENGLVDSLQLRLDSNQAQPIMVSQLERNPFLLKTLFRGTSLDVGILNEFIKIESTVKSLCAEYGLEKCNGYKKGAQEDLEDDEKAKRLAQYKNLCALNGVQLTPKSAKIFNGRPLINESLLPSFNDDEEISYIERDRESEIYQGPLVIIPENSKGTPMCYLGKRSLIYSQSYLGISTCAHDEPELLAVYLSIVLRTDIRRYIGLLTTSRYGVNRNTLPIETTEQMQIPLFETLSVQDKAYCKTVLERWKSGDLETEEHRAELFAWVCSLYHVSSQDQQVINDTLATLCPSKRSAAQKHPTQQAVKSYRAIIQKSLTDIYKLYGVEQRTPRVSASSLLVSGWRFIEIGDESDLNASEANLIAGIIEQLSKDEGLSQCIVPVGNKMLVGRLNQYRYWTKSRARLMAHDILSVIDKDRNKWGLSQ